MALQLPMHTHDRMLFERRVSNMDRWLNQLFAVQTLFYPHLSRHNWLLETPKYDRNIGPERLMGNQ